MEETKGIFGMDVHRFLRSFVPALISILTFLPFLFLVNGNDVLINLNYFKDTSVIFSILIFAYILGVLLEWISHVCLYRFYEDWAYTEKPFKRYEILDFQV